MPMPILRDVSGGLISALVNVVYCLSFGALIFRGDLADGLALGQAALLTGSAVTGLVVALSTTLSPADAGPDTPAIAVMSVLAAAVAANMGAGSTEQIVTHVMLAITLSTLFTGLLLFALGQFRAGHLLRFIPYPVVAGFLAASGWLLIAGAIQMITGARITPDNMTETIFGAGFAQIVVGLVFVLILLAGRIWSRAGGRGQSYVLLPATFLGMGFFLYIGLAAGLVQNPDSWFVAGSNRLQFWWPAAVALDGSTDWLVFSRVFVEIAAVGFVTAIALLLDVSSLEVATAKSADLDHELRTNGGANIAASLIGGFTGNLSLQGSMLIREAGGLSRLSGVVAALTLALVVISGFDIAQAIPTALMGGLLAWLGGLIIYKALFSLPVKRSLMDLSLALAILAVIVAHGYLAGVAAGIVGACLIFALSYSRIGVVRRHLTAAEFSSNVERSSEETQLLRAHGGSIHLIWLSGYIFFGQSNGLFEYIRRSIMQQAGRSDPVRYIVLDFSAVPGLDSSAALSLVKLRNFASESQVSLVLSGLPETINTNLVRAGFFPDDGSVKKFATRNDAHEWCESALLGDAGAGNEPAGDLESWLSSELGTGIDVTRLSSYFERQEVQAGDILFEQGSPADTMELVLSGSVAVTVTDDIGRIRSLRRMAGLTVVGEMGFYRDATRSASVSAERASVVYRLTRTALKRCEKDDPELASAIHKFIIRVLADRLEFANQEIGALLP